MKKILRVIGLALIVLIALPVAAATAAAPYTVGEVSVSNTSPAPGESVDVSASGFQPNSEVDIFFRSTPVLLASVTTDAAGEVTATVTIPSNSSGEHQIEVVGMAPDGSARTVSVGVVVAADGDTSSAPLPSTGSSAAPTLIVATLVALVGVALLVGTRVRRRARSV